MASDFDNHSGSYPQITPTLRLAQGLSLTIKTAVYKAVLKLGGLYWAAQLGRRDSTTVSLDAANTDIPSPIMDVADLVSAFSNKGFSEKEMVALSGALTIWQARCTVFRNRIYNESNIFASLATSLKSNCPFNGSDENLSPIDTTSPLSFDNAYLRI